MPMNFHAPANAGSYATRTVDASWRDAIAALVNPAGKRVVDVGCGGGIYARAWAELGAAHVTGVDFSAAMLDQAARTCAGLPSVTFAQGEASATGLPSGAADIVFERALLHHVPDLAAVVAEAYRLLASGGIYLAQDRTPEDSRAPGRPDYPRGYFHERFPRLLEVEVRRRPSPEAMRHAALAAGFHDLRQQPLVEVRRMYTDFDELADDIRARIERSILHELSDDELEELIAYMRPRIPAGQPVRDASQWTLWVASK